MSNSISEFNLSKRQPFYLIRKGLFEAVSENAHHLSGIMMDFGCGSKPYKDLVKVDEYIGVDYNGEGHSHEDEQIDVFYDGTKIPFPDNHFDSILCSEVLEHIFDVDVVVSELSRVLKPNGKILITCPFVWNEHEVPVDFARYTQFALTSIFTKRGFRVVNFEKKGTYIETIFQLLNLYNLHLLSKGGVFRNIPVLRQFAWHTLEFMPSVYNFIGEKLSAILPKADDIYMSNVLVVQKDEKL